MFPRIDADGRNQAPIVLKKNSSIRAVNFCADPVVAEHSVKSQHSHTAHSSSVMPQKGWNLEQEIQRLIPLRGPTLFDRQMTDYLHGPSSKSGMKMNP